MNDFYKQMHADLRRLTFAAVDEWRENSNRAMGEFVDDLQPWLVGVIGQMPYDGWNDAIGEFVGRWNARGVDIAPESIRSLTSGLAALNNRAEKHTPPGVRIPIDIVGRPNDSDELIAWLEQFGRVMMGNRPPDQWLARAEEIAFRFQLPEQVKRRFLDWIASEHRDALARSEFLKLLDQLRHEKRPPGLNDAPNGVFGTVRDYVATKDPKQLVALLRQRVDRFAENGPKSFAGRDLTKDLSQAQELIHEVLDLIEALPPEAHEAGFELLQLTLDLGGLIPGLGEPFDALSGTLSAVQGEYFDAALSAGSLIPLGGVLTGAAKLVKRIDRLRRLVAKLEGPARLVFERILDFWEITRESLIRLWKGDSGAIDPNIIYEILFRFRHLLRESADNLLKQVPGVLVEGRLRRFLGKGFTLGRATRRKWRKTFFRAYKHIPRSTWVHHAVPRHVLDEYKGLFDETELHSLENLRGIPLEKTGSCISRQLRHCGGSSMMGFQKRSSHES